MEDNEQQAAEANQSGEEQVEIKAEEIKEAPADAESSLEDFSKFEPELRKRPIDYIEERKARRAERPVAEDRSLEVEESDEELTPKAQEFLRKEAEKLLSPIKTFVTEDWNQREIAEAVSSKPEWKKYEPLAKKYMSADGWQGVPAKRIFQMLDYEYSGERGADAEREKARSASRARGGESGRSVAMRGNAELSAQDIAKLSSQQHLDLQRRLAMGESIKT